MSYFQRDFRRYGRKANQLSRDLDSLYRPQTSTEYLKEVGTHIYFRCLSIIKASFLSCLHQYKLKIVSFKPAGVVTLWCNILVAASYPYQQITDKAPHTTSIVCSRILANVCCVRRKLLFPQCCTGEDIPSSFLW